MTRYEVRQIPGLNLWTIWDKTEDRPAEVSLALDEPLVSDDRERMELATQSLNTAAAELTGANAICQACGWTGDTDKLEDQAECPKCGQYELSFL
jgi:predicted Zn-ribbon and HTH transcriptional regulator